MNLAEGNIVAEHYKLLRQLGHGSFGDVWLAHNLLADIDVAIKFYGVLDQKGLEEFRNEFKIAYKLHHPNLLNINHFDVFENCPYLVMPYCENGSVSRQVGQMPESEIWKFVLDVSGGLAFLHSQKPPIVHQDIKPDNILITSDGRYVISDFGISRSFRTQMSRTNNVSSSGTIAYMGPERFSEKPMVVLASDIWAFGMTLYELMTGDVLWEGMGGCVQLNGARLPVISGNFSNELTQLVTACLAAETWNRPTATQINDYASAYIQKRTMPILHIQEQAKPSQKAPSTATYSPAYTQQGQQSVSSPSYNYQSHQHTEPHSSSSGIEQGGLLSQLKNFFSNQQNLKRGGIIAAALFAAFLLMTGVISVFSSISEEHAFVSCKSKQDYEQFIKDYPSSSYVETAKKRIAALTPQETPVQQEDNKPDATPVPKNEPKPATLYVKEKSQTDIASSKPRTVKQTKSTTATKMSDNDDQTFYRCITSKDYHTYLTNFPNGRHRKEAEQQLTDILNQTNGNEINLNNNSVPENRIHSNVESRTSFPQRTTRRQVGVRNFNGGGSYGGGYRGSSPRGGGMHRNGGGSSHRHSN